MNTSKIKPMYDSFVNKYGYAPTYVSAQIMWKDDEQTEEVFFKLDDGYDEEDDEYVFFSCHGIEDFIEIAKDDSLEKDGGEDFIVTNVFSMEERIC